MNQWDNEPQQPYQEKLDQLDVGIARVKEQIANNRLGRRLMGEGKHAENHFSWHRLSDSRKLVVLAGVLILLVVFLIGSELVYTYLMDNPYLPPEK